MRFGRAAPFVLILLYACFLAYWGWSGTQLPATVATHFNGHGEPNGWMSRSANQYFILLFALGLPVFIVGLFFAARFLPAALFNIPNRAYWLAPGRKEQTTNYLARHSLWLACLIVGLALGIQYSIVQTNCQSPPHLSVAVFLQVITPFAAGLVIWLWVLVQHFRKRSAS